MKNKTLWSKIKEKLKDKYRLVVMNEDTLKETISFRLNLLAFYTLISSLLILLFILFWLLTAYTPLKRFMPGYNDIYAHPEFIDLYNRISEIEAGYEAQQLYTENLRKLLLGEVDSSDIEQENTLEKATTGGQLNDINQGTAQSASLTVAKTESVSEDFQQIKTLESNISAKTSLRKIHLIPPVNGYISAPFDPLNKHYGVDLVAPRNTAVKSIASGYVFSSDWTLETGNSIGIVHDNNVISFYKHNAVNLKKAGTFVKAGEAIAIIGNTGMLTDGPHLHFELWVDGVPVNPEEYFIFK